MPTVDDINAILDAEIAEARKRASESLGRLIDARIDAKVAALPTRIIHEEGGDSGLSEEEVDARIDRAFENFDLSDALDDAHVFEDLRRRVDTLEEPGDDDEPSAQELRDEFRAEIEDLRSVVNDQHEVLLAIKTTLYAIANAAGALAKLDPANAA